MSDSDDDTKSGIDASSMPQQIDELQKLVALQLQVKSIVTPPLRSTPTISSHEVKHVHTPEGRYSMNSAEFRMYSKDCRDFKTLTRFHR